MDVFSVKDASELTGISRPSLRVYTTKYARWLSTEATPARGQARTFTAADLRTLRYVYEQTQAGATHDQVMARLDAGELESYAWHVPAQEEPQDSEPTGVMAPDQVAILQGMFEELRAQLAQAAQRETQLRERVDDLTMQLGETKGRLAERKSGKWQAPAWFRAIFGSRAD